MFVLTRKLDETFTFSTREPVSSDEEFRQLCASVEVKLLRIHRNRVALGITAPPQIQIIRGSAPPAVQEETDSTGCEQVEHQDSESS